MIRLFLRFTDITLERLPTLFPEFSDYVEACKFNPCYHEHEPICGIKEALANHKIFEMNHRKFSFHVRSLFDISNNLS